MKKIKLFIWKGIIAILTTAVCSAFWEFWIKDGVLRISKSTVKIVSLFSEKSTDFIYTNPYQGDILFISFPTMFFVIGSIFFFIYIYIVQSRQLRKLKDNLATKSDQIDSGTSEQDTEEDPAKDLKFEILANYIVKAYPWLMGINISIYSIFLLVIFSTSTIKLGIKRTCKY